MKLKLPKHSRFFIKKWLKCLVENAYKATIWIGVYYLWQHLL